MRNAGLQTVPFLAISLFMPALLVAQSGGAGGAQQTVAAMEGRIAGQLSERQPPDLVKGALARDRTVVSTAQPRVTEDFKRFGYSNTDAEAALAWSWFSLRVGKDAVPLGTSLSVGSIQTKALSMGKVVVKSDPTGAAIFVDQLSQGTGTDSFIFADVGLRRVRVEKAGLAPAESTCSVQRDREATFTSTLSATGSTAACK